ncbi:MAG: SHOCT domain-containing protein [Gammaproteobacteria bacterium]|nr:SHOCT domain-containing protein [Gammaproteobacteria bacterium]
MDRTVKNLLDERLARGEISVEEYERIRDALRPPGEDSATAPRPAQLAKDSRPIASVDELDVYEDRIVVKGERVEFSAIRSVKDSAYKMSINFMPVSRMASLLITLTDGRFFVYYEDRALLGIARCGRITKAGAVLRAATFRHRRIDFATRLRSVGRIPVAESEQGNVFITSDGCLEQGQLRIDLKQAARTGVVGQGTHAGVGANSSSNSSEIVAGYEKPGWAGWGPNTIRFEPYLEDPDVVGSMVEWLAEPNNTL